MRFFRSYHPNDAELRNGIRNVVQWLDELFSRKCVVANTIETISLINTMPRCYCLDLIARENTSFADELFHDHMLKHWHFPFPALQS